MTRDAFEKAYRYFRMGGALPWWASRVETAACAAVSARKRGAYQGLGLSRAIAEDAAGPPAHPWHGGAVEAYASRRWGNRHPWGGGGRGPFGWRPNRRRIRPQEGSGYTTRLRALPG